MSVSYEPRNFIHDGAYAPVGEHDHTTVSLDRFTDPDVPDLAAVAAGTYTVGGDVPSPFPDSEPHLDLGPPPPVKDDSPVPVQTPTLAPAPRIKPIPKPDRPVTRTVDGKFYCNHAGCTEEVREFQRKCEWSKHMDKHDRPYKCTAEGCEKLPGFTYSGGLLRHEREVHGKHGGPKNPLHCPHVNCKRHTGKGFSRQENLAEHLRRVHTGNGNPSGGEETDDAVSLDTPAAAGTKRKRASDGDELVDLREEIKRVRRENEELRQQVDNQNRQTTVMMQQIQALRHEQDQLRLGTAALL